MKIFFQHGSILFLLGVMGSLTFFPPSARGEISFQRIGTIREATPDLIKETTYEENDRRMEQVLGRIREGWVLTRFELRFSADSDCEFASAEGCKLSLSRFSLPKGAILMVPYLPQSGATPELDFWTNDHFVRFGVLGYSAESTFPDLVNRYGGEDSTLTAHLIYIGPNIFE